jgi:hypothetical protein
MPYISVAVAPSREVFEKVQALTGSDLAAGQLLRSAGELSDGTVQVVSVWQSKDAADAFGEQLFPAFGQAGVAEQVRALPSPTTYEPFDYAS